MPLELFLKQRLTCISSRALVVLIETEDANDPVPARPAHCLFLVVYRDAADGGVGVVMNEHPANTLLRAFAKLQKEQADYHDRMADIARRAFRNPTTDISGKLPSDGNNYDADLGQGQRDHLEDNQ